MVTSVIYYLRSQSGSKRVPPQLFQGRPDPRVDMNGSALSVPLLLRIEDLPA